MYFKAIVQKKKRSLKWVMTLCKMSILQMNYTCYGCKHFHHHPDGGSACNLDG